tara:strand:- start:9772 stop:10548 length:777 start_codon:yes stop_codon:yes gene_type:complete
MASLTNKTIIVTGGGRGIGAACCKLLAAEGANVIITCRSNNEGKAIESEIHANKGSALYINHDVRHEKSWQVVLEKVLSSFPKIDSVVNCAGGYNFQTIKECSHESFKAIINTSLDGCFLGLKYGTEAIRKHGHGGSIVMMSSILSKIGNSNMSALSAAHGGIKLLAKAAACELGPEKIRVNSIHPGFVETYSDEEFKKYYPDSVSSLEYEKNSVDMIPFQRKATSQEIAEAIRFLVSDESVFMTGAEITIDGGLLAQ